MSSKRSYNRISRTMSEINKHFVVCKHNLKHIFHVLVHLRARLHSGPIRYCFGITLRGKNFLLYELIAGIRNADIIGRKTLPRDLLLTY